MSTIADEREWISSSLRKEQTALFLRMEMSSHKVLKPPSPLKPQKGTLQSCWLSRARPSPSSEVHVFCCDNKVICQYVHSRLKLNHEIKEETMTLKRTVSVHPCMGPGEMWAAADRTRPTWRQVQECSWAALTAQRAVPQSPHPSLLQHHSPSHNPALCFMLVSVLRGLSLSTLDLLTAQQTLSVSPVSFLQVQWAQTGEQGPEQPRGSAGGGQSGTRRNMRGTFQFHGTTQ